MKIMLKHSVCKSKFKVKKWLSYIILSLLDVLEELPAIYRRDCYAFKSTVIRVSTLNEELWDTEHM